MSTLQPYSSSALSLVPSFVIETTGPMVGRPRLTDSQFRALATAVASGRHQRKVATELGWSLSAVKHALGRMRALLAAKHGAEWLDPMDKTPVEVAIFWLSLPPGEGIEEATEDRSAQLTAAEASASETKEPRSADADESKPEKS